MEKLFFAFPGNEELASDLAGSHFSSLGKATFKHFPDGETFVQIHSDVYQKQVIIVCSLHQPDEKFMRLHFFCRIAREMGCGKLSLVAPYLSYMRQDKIFHTGEGLTSSYFASLISACVDELFTIDPHLHRIPDLSQVYTIPCKVQHAADHIARWIKTCVSQPLLIGPDSESEQWVKEVAEKAGASYTVLHKVRKGDKEVEVSLPQVEKYRDHTPVLVDDIISTGRTMIETVMHLKATPLKAPVCIGIHAVFAGSAFEDLLAAGAAKVVTCTTIPHISNAIHISDLFKL